MREIKFRVWDSMPGYQMMTATFSLEDIENGFNVTGRDRTVMQSTGLTDRNGVEIYEGDIVRFYRINEYSHKHEPRHISSVYWANGGFQFTDKHAPNRTLASLWRPGESMEVIGNIYENSDLLSK